MEIIDRFKKVYRKFFNRSFNKDSKSDMQAMMALAYLLNQQGLNLSANFYFHFKPDENGLITSAKLVEYIKENKFYERETVFYNKDIKVIADLFNSVKDYDNKKDIILTMAKITYLQNQRGYFREKDLKNAYLELYPNDKYFKQAYDAICGVRINSATIINRIISKKDTERTF